MAGHVFPPRADPRLALPSLLRGDGECLSRPPSAPSTCAIFGCSIASGAMGCVYTRRWPIPAGHTRCRRPCSPPWRRGPPPTHSSPARSSRASRPPSARSLTTWATRSPAWASSARRLRSTAPAARGGPSREAGVRGAHNLIAEVDEDQPAFECLRRAGFAVYARQQIWRWEGTPSPEQAYDDVWRSEAPGDGEAIAWLVANLVPGLVLQVEAAPGRSRRGLLHWAEGELRAYLDLERGPRGVWAQPTIHPAVEAIDMLLAAFLRRSAESDRPVYLCLRSYQSWMVGALVRLGFERVADQAVMVRRLAATVRRAVPAPLPGLQGPQGGPAPPVARPPLSPLSAGAA